MEVDIKAHWEKIYREKKTDQLSWYQRYAHLSRTLIESIASDKGAFIIDIGGGASVLVDDLMVAGYRNLTVLDLSEYALENSKKRLGEAADTVIWKVANVLDAGLPDQAFDVWHDRAVFHFFISGEEQRRYIDGVRKALAPGGHVVIATFAENGPPSCSGMKIQRYSPQTLCAVFGDEFRLIHSVREVHLTPDGRPQDFIYGVFRMLA